MVNTYSLTNNLLNILIYYVNLIIISIISKQLCINVQLPEMAGGLNGVALYIDTNQGFSPIRLKGFL